LANVVEERLVVEVVQDARKRFAPTAPQRLDGTRIELDGRLRIPKETRR